MTDRTASTIIRNSASRIEPTHRQKAALVGLAAIAGMTLMPRPAAAFPYDPHVVMYTFMSSGVDLFTSTYNVGGMPEVVQAVGQCYAVNDRPQWMGRFITCNAEDDAAYVYSIYASRHGGVAPLPYFVRTAFLQRQNAVLATYGMPPSKRLAWINAMLRRVASLVLPKARAGMIGVQR